MNELSPFEDKLEETKRLLSAGKELMVQVAYNLFSLRNSEDWKRYGHESFPKFCQEELELSQSTTSKYLAIAEHFSQKYSPEEIGPVAVENLYLAAKLGETPEESLAKARTWRREDFKQEAREKDPNTPEWFGYHPETISRIEVINYADESGRAYTYWPRDKKLHVALQLQDDGKTLKVFIDNAQELPS